MGAGDTNSHTHTCTVSDLRLLCGRWRCSVMAPVGRVCCWRNRDPGVVEVFWTVAIGERALSLDPWCTLNVAWTSGVHSRAEWRSWVDGYWEKPAVLGEGFPAVGFFGCDGCAHSRSVRVRGQLVGVRSPSFIYFWGLNSGQAWL